jgi:dTDP-4-amino-4,6-dideoxygalactose transaminase
MLGLTVLIDLNTVPLKLFAYGNTWMTNEFIPFNLPPVSGDEITFIQQALKSSKISGGGEFSQKCEHYFKETTKTKDAYLVPSCTAALEFCAILIDIKLGDEVIIPSFTFVSTANAFALRGAKIVFADVDSVTFNMGVEQVESLITSKTKAIVAVHYGGMSCEIDKLRELADTHNLILIEDAAQAVASSYNNQALGTFGHLGTYSFHETKNISSGGEGGMLLVNEPRLVERAAIIQEKGTNRKQFFEGRVDKYSWMDLGSSYLLGEMSAAYLWAQIININKIQTARKTCWGRYQSNLAVIKQRFNVKMSVVPEYNNGNAHLFFLCIPNRAEFISYLAKHGICGVFHYVPLHQSDAGKKFGEIRTSLKNSELAGEQLVRLPLYHDLSLSNVDRVCEVVTRYFMSRVDA